MFSILNRPLFSVAANLLTGFSGFSDAEKNIPGYLINPTDLLLFLQAFIV
ncbi:MAG TPA: hypothetical protein VNX40_00935 [Mucilaginibacter sp.]|jgi:hypothetical protein|nr:hypothetical protein [Mucilaginibacter sp.]